MNIRCTITYTEETKLDIKELKARAHNLKPMIRIGKSGLTDTVIDEINLQLKKKKLIKIKLLKSAQGEKSKLQLRDELIEKTRSILVSNIGFIITLYRAKS